MCVRVIGQRIFADLDLVILRRRNILFSCDIFLCTSFDDESGENLLRCFDQGRFPLVNVSARSDISIVKIE